MKVLVITVGTSAITNDQIGAVDGRNNTALRASVKRYLDLRKENRTLAMGEQLAADLRDAHKLFWRKPQDYLGFAAHQRQTSAELLSTHDLLRLHLTRGWSKDLDRLLLLHSDTDEGRLAAKVNAEILRTTWGWSDVVMAEVQALNEAFVDVHQRLADCFAQHVPESPKPEVVVNITGGYKGTIPALTLIAAANKWMMYCKHESAAGPAAIAFEQQALAQLDGTGGLKRASNPSR
ncbi:MAG: hypothetical protein K2X03_01520 [Bryobacteraceae bacterium]|nr:hypothetical protein [Bryobacteraceae bacterium]